MAIVGEIKGLDAWEKVLRALSSKMRRSVVAGSLRAGARVMRGSIKAHTPVASGALRDSIRVTTGRAKKPGVVRVFVGPSAKGFTGKTWYGGPIEFGWKLGQRRRDVARVALRIHRMLRVKARAFRTVEGAAEGAALAKRGTVLRDQQERTFAREGWRQGRKQGTERKKMPGEFFVKAGFDEGSSAARQAVEETATKLLGEAVRESGGTL